MRELSFINNTKNIHKFIFFCKIKMEISPAYIIYIDPRCFEIRLSMLKNSGLIYRNPGVKSPPFSYTHGSFMNSRRGSISLTIPPLILPLLIFKLTFQLGPGQHSTYLNRTPPNQSSSSLYGEDFEPNHLLPARFCGRGILPDREAIYDHSFETKDDIQSEIIERIPDPSNNHRFYD